MHAADFTAILALMVVWVACVLVSLALQQTVRAQVVTPLPPILLNAPLAESGEQRGRLHPEFMCGSGIQPPVAHRWPVSPHSPFAHLPYTPTHTEVPANGTCPPFNEDEIDPVTLMPKEGYRLVFESECTMAGLLHVTEEGEGYTCSWPRLMLAMPMESTWEFESGHK